MKTPSILAVTVLALTAAQPALAAPQNLVATEAPPTDATAKVDLGAEFPQFKGYTFTQGVATVPPGSGRAWHSHVGMPEIVHIISGTLTEAHNGGAPTTYGPGSTLINAAGTQHMWANFGTEPVVFVATQVRAPGK